MSQNEEACLFQASPLRASPRSSPRGSPHASPGARSSCPASPPPAPPPLCNTPLSPTPGTSAEAQPVVMEDQDLDEDTLQLLGDAPKTDITMGPSVHKDIANRWQDILTKGLAKDVKEKLLKSYFVPKNCDLLLAPALNPEVKAALQDTLVKRDLALMYKQNQLGMALSALASATDMIISNETSKQKLLKPISDACRILCDSHFWETKTRRNFIISSININLKDALLETKRGSFLFGENVTDKVKAAKSIQQSGDALKHALRPKYNKARSIPKGPNKGNLNYNPQHRKTYNKPNNARRAARPTYRPPPPAQAGGNSRRYSSPTRQPHRK